MTPDTSYLPRYELIEIMKGTFAHDCKFNYYYNQDIVLFTISIREYNNILFQENSRKLAEVLKLPLWCMGDLTSYKLNALVADYRDAICMDQITWQFRELVLDAPSMMYTFLPQEYALLFPYKAIKEYRSYNKIKRFVYDNL